VQLLPVAERELPREVVAELDVAFRGHSDPLAAGGPQPGYERLFARILVKTPD